MPSVRRAMASCEVELPEQEVGCGDVPDQCDENAAARLLAGERDGCRRFRLPPDFAEEIQLPRQLKPAGPVLVRRVVAFCGRRRLAHAVTRRQAVDLRVEVRLRDARSRAHFFDARDSHSQVQVVRDRAFRISSCSAGSSKTWNHGASASVCACAGSAAKRCCGGLGSWGRE